MCSKLVISRTAAPHLQAQIFIQATVLELKYIPIYVNSKSMYKIKAYITQDIPGICKISPTNIQFLLNLWKQNTGEII